MYEKVVEYDFAPTRSCFLVDTENNSVVIFIPMTLIRTLYFPMDAAKGGPAIPVLLFDRNWRKS